MVVIYCYLGIISATLKQETLFLNGHPTIAASQSFKIKQVTFSLLISHCVKSVQIRSYFRSAFSCIQSEYRKIPTRNNSVFGHISRSVKNSLIELGLPKSMFRKLARINPCSFIQLPMSALYRFWQYLYLLNDVKTKQFIISYDQDME